MKPKNLKYIIGILCMAMLMQNVCAEITVSRDLPETAVLGSEVTINLKLDIVGGETSGIIITEKVPEGVSVSSISNEGSFNPETGEIKWLIYGEKIDSQTLSYTAAASELGTYTFSGTFTTLEEGVGEIDGDENISIEAGGIAGFDINLLHIAAGVIILILIIIIFLVKRKK